MTEQQWDRIQGGVYGMLVGDALGVPYEFQESEDIPGLEGIEFHPPAGFRRSHEGVPPGTWSDDGAQALCLLVSLLECGRLDQADYAQRLVNWYNQGYMAIDQNVFDVGITTASSIRCLMNGISPENSGATGDYDNGNGSLMRVLPLALWHRGSDEDLVEAAHQQSHITHAHMRSKVCCALYCLWARNILREDSEPWTNALANLRGKSPGDLRTGVVGSAGRVRGGFRVGVCGGFAPDRLRHPKIPFLRSDRESLRQNRQ